MWFSQPAAGRQGEGNEKHFPIPLTVESDYSIGEQSLLYRNTSIK